MSKVEWSPYFHIKEEHPWPDAVHVVRGDERKLYLKEQTCHDLGGVDENGEQVFNCSECGCVMSLYDSDGSSVLCTSFIFDYPHFCPACGARAVS